MVCKAENGLAAVSVRDYGIGISLYLCYEIITRHGGYIQAESVPGQGTTFYFSLPLVNG